MKNIVILTGAGISAESGIATFRDSGGLWAEHRVEDVATPEGYAANPKLVLDFYNERRRQLKDARPNAAHYALSELERRFNGSVWIITQNVDDLHERAGSRNLIHMHGELLKVCCTKCGALFHTEADITLESVCGKCHHKGSLRPDIVWFGEMPKSMDIIEELLLNADMFISIGTSGSVYPAAGFVSAVSKNARTIELNLEKSYGASNFKEHIYGKASVIVPDYVNNLLNDVSK